MSIVVKIFILYYPKNKNNSLWYLYVTCMLIFCKKLSKLGHFQLKNAYFKHFSSKCCLKTTKKNYLGDFRTSWRYFLLPLTSYIIWSKVAHFLHLAIRDITTIVFITISIQPTVRTTILPKLFPACGGYHYLGNFVPLATTLKKHGHDNISFQIIPKNRN